MGIVIACYAGVDKLALCLHRDSEERHEFPDNMKAVVLDTKEAVTEIICAGE